jgi:hypothetical protein
MKRDEHWRAFGPEWFDRHQRVLLWLLACPILGRWLRWVLRIRKCDVGYGREILEIRPHCYTVPGPEPGQLTTDFRTHWKYAKRVYYAFRPLWWALHWWDALIAERWVPELAFGFATLTVYPDPNPGVTSKDGDVSRQSVDESWASITSGAATVATDDASIMDVASFQASATTNQWSKLYRAVLLFDASLLLASPISATLSLFGGSKGDGLGSAPDINVYSTNPSSNTVVETGDFTTFGSTPFASAIEYANWTDGAYNALIFNASGLAAIVDGICKFGTRNANYDVAGVQPPWASGLVSEIDAFPSDQSGISQDPKLVIVFDSSGMISRPASLRPNFFSPGIAR